MPIYDQPILHQHLRALPKVSLDEKHKYVKDNCFQTSFTGKLTDEAIHKYALKGFYGHRKMVAAQAEETLRQLQKKTTKKRKDEQGVNAAILANKYANL